MNARLEKLQKSGQYVFHGSNRNDITSLEPRQAYSHGEPEDDPAIFAADVIEPPIFMAVLGSRKVGGWGDRTLPGYGFYIDKATFEKAHAENWKGYVYALPKTSFRHTGAYEWRSSEAVEPACVIEVGINDLPEGIAVR